MRALLLTLLLTGLLSAAEARRPPRTSLLVAAPEQDPPLDRAAFKAAQEGRVVVVGTTRPETIAALMEWSIEGKGASVALAPISAVLAVK